MNLTPENLAELFRFALLLTGDADAASDVVAGAVEQIPDEFTQLRGEKSGAVWLLRKIRERSVVSPGRLRVPLEKSEVESGEDDVGDVAAFHSLLQNLGGDGTKSVFAERFATLAEPGRSVLALFYLDLLDLREMSQFFALSLEELSAEVTDARKGLREALAR